MTPSRSPCWSSTTSRPNLRLLDAVLTPRGYDVSNRRLRRGGVGRARRGGRRPRAARHPDARDGRLRGLPRHPRGPATAFLPVVMITASGDQERLRALEAGADDFVDQALRPGRVAGPGRVPGAGQALPRHRSPAGRRARARGTRARGPGAAPRSSELDRLGRLRRFLSPQLAELVVDLGRRLVPAQPPSRDRRGVLRPAGFTPFAETVEPEEVMARARRVPPRARRADPPLRGHPGAVHRRRADGVLQRPAAVPGRAGARVRMAVAMRERVRDLAEDWAGAATSSRFGIGDRAGYATLGRIGFEGRYDYAAIGSVTNLAARLCERGGPGRSSSPVGSSRPPATATRPIRSETCGSEGSAAPSPCSTSFPVRSAMTSAR